MNEMGVHQDVREKVVRDAFKFMSENADYVIIHRAFKLQTRQLQLSYAVLFIPGL